MSAYTITRDGSRVTMTGGAHEDAYAPVELTLDEVSGFILMLKQVMDARPDVVFGVQKAA